jgi:hypothetical protein
MMPDCVLHVNGARFADTAAALRAGAPTALAQLEVVWGRDTTVDQPAAATCHAVIEDRTGGATFLESVVDVGAALEVTATGDIATDAPRNVVADPGFETLPPGAITGAVAVQTGSASMVTAPVHTGLQAVAYDPASTAWLVVPPAPFDPADPTVWDAIPRFDPAYVWTWSLAVRPDLHQDVTVTPVVLTGPTTPVPGPYAGLGYTITGDGAWHVMGGSTTAASGAPAGWLGLRVQVGPRPPWTIVPGTWATVPATWMDYRGVVVDDAELAVPAGSVWRPALVFSGVVTDLTATMDRVGTLRVEVTAVDQLAVLENRGVGDVPWPAETLAARVQHILTAAGVTHPARIDAPLDTEVVSWLDVDNQPAASLLAEHAQGVDGVLWSATHATTGPYLWIENPAQRAQTGELEQQGALVVIVSVDEARGATSLDGCLLPLDPITWVRDVSDVLTRVDATWSEQTLNDTGQPAPTDHTVTVYAEQDVLDRHGVRRYSVTTKLTTEADAEDVAQRVINRSSTLAWRTTGLELDLALTPPTAAQDVVNVLDLLDGSTRLGRALIVNDADLWPGKDPIGLYLEGGSYTFDGAWRLALNGSAHTGLGASVAWNELDPTWMWQQFDRSIRWFDLYGVAA